MDFIENSKQVMNIKTAKFVVSNQNAKQCPKDNIPEYAFIGRSNVGKSSLINMLANNKKLAKTSSKPYKSFQNRLFLVSRRFTWLWLRKGIKNRKKRISKINY